jgi:uncharacterized membrane protein
MSETSSPAPRSGAIDVIRGAVMVLMAIDHVRVFSGVPAGGPSAGIFFTRWITHFCAPAFVFFAGTGAWLHERTHADLSRFLVIRGAWLILLELTVLRFAWTFNFDYAHSMLGGVIWAIGWCMILMAAVVRLPLRAIGLLGCVIVAGHNLVGPSVVAAVNASPDSIGGAIGKILYVGFFAGPVALGSHGPPLTILYSIVPWIGVMAAGYAFGAVMAEPADKRRRTCVIVGTIAIASFLVLRGINLYGDPRPWISPGAAPAGRPAMPALLSFLNTTKYPASLDFLLMTLGPTILLIPWAEAARGPIARALAVFGRVPLFYYLLHIPLIHLLAIAVSLARTGAVSPWLFANHPMGNPEPPDGYVWSLPLLYAVWAIAVALLYPACRWYAGFKATHRARWLRFV